MLLAASKVGSTAWKLVVLKVVQKAASMGNLREVILAVKSVEPRAERKAAVRAGTRVVLMGEWRAAV